MDQGQNHIPFTEQFADTLIGDIADYVYDLQQLDNPEIARILEEARRRMLEDGVIESAKPAEPLGEMVAVDGGNNVLSQGAGTQYFVLVVRYSLREDYDIAFRMKRLTFEHEEATPLMYGVRNALEVDEIYRANESASFCIVDNSWVSLLQNINRTLVHYRDASPLDRKTIEAYLEPLLARNGSFITTLRHPRNIAISKAGLARQYCELYTDNQLSLPDKVFLLGVLKPGEHTLPKPLAQSGQGQLNVHTDPIFASQNEIKETYNATLQSNSDCICSTYFKPHPWSPVKRIEFHQELLRNDRQLLWQMLATVSSSMKIPTISEPLEQYLVDEIVKRHTGRLPDLYKTASIANVNPDSGFALQLVREFRT